MISIAMTTYNGEKYIERQLRSILEQTLPADEIVICDDCSKDSTVEIIRCMIAETGDHRIRLIENEQNLGYTRNFFKAISLTSGDYIFLADQDDEWHSDKLERSLQLMEQTGASAICTNCRFINEHSELISPADRVERHPFISRVTQTLTQIPIYELALDNIAQGCTYCFTKEVKQIYLNINSSSVIHDYQIMLVAVLTGTVYFLNDPLIDYRLHSSNAVGFQKSDKKLTFKLKLPSRKPDIICFLDDMEKEMQIPFSGLCRLLYYLRIPKFVLFFRKQWQDR